MNELKVKKLILNITVKEDKVEFKLYSNLLNTLKLSYCIS